MALFHHQGCCHAVANANDAPSASAVIANQSTNEDAGFSFAVPPASFTDADVGDTLTLSATLADGSPLPAWLSFNPATQTFSGTPLNGDVGSLSIRVTATDSSGASATQDFQVAVNNTNDAPVITSSGASLPKATAPLPLLRRRGCRTTLTYSIRDGCCPYHTMPPRRGHLQSRRTSRLLRSGGNNVYDYVALPTALHHYKDVAFHHKRQ